MQEIHLLLLHQHSWVLLPAACLPCSLVLWVLVLLLEALGRELEAGLGQLALVGDGIFLGHGLGGWEGAAHLHRWLIHRAKEGEDVRQLLSWPSGFSSGLLEGQKLPQPFPGAVGAHLWLGQGRDSRDVPKGSSHTAPITHRIWQG